MEVNWRRFCLVCISFLYLIVNSFIECDRSWFHLQLGFFLSFNVYAFDVFFYFLPHSCTVILCTSSRHFGLCTWISQLCPQFSQLLSYKRRILICNIRSFTSLTKHLPNFCLKWNFVFSCAEIIKQIKKVILCSKLCAGQGL